MRAPGRGAAPGGGAPAAAPSRPPGRGGPPGRGPIPGRPPMGGRPPGVGAVRVGCMGRRSPARIGGREPGAPVRQVHRQDPTIVRDEDAGRSAARVPADPCDSPWKAVVAHVAVVAAARCKPDADPSAAQSCGGLAARAVGQASVDGQSQPVAACGRQVWQARQRRRGGALPPQPERPGPAHDWRRSRRARYQPAQPRARQPRSLRHGNFRRSGSHRGLDRRRRRVGAGGAATSASGAGGGGTAAAGGLGISTVET